MADPATTAMLIKSAIAAATDKKTWRNIGIFIGIVLFILMLPILIIMSVGKGSADSNQSVAKIVFDGAPPPSNATAEQRQFILEMEDALGKLSTAIASVNQAINGESLDDTQVKAYFFTLYFGKDLSAFDEAFYKNFAETFTEKQAGSNNASDTIVPLKDKDKIHQNLTDLTGQTITDALFANITSLYNYIKFGYTPDSFGFTNGRINAIGSGNLDGIPAEALADADFATLMNEATKFVGWPYRWAGSSPQTSFDCSGFVCWSYTQSGVHNLPRTTAQGIYNQTTPVSKDELKPGDLVFFTGTYAGAPQISHIGIYVGNGKMIHAGDPIGYADLSKSYWQKHLVGYGRLS